MIPVHDKLGACDPSTHGGHGVIVQGLLQLELSSNHLHNT